MVIIGADLHKRTHTLVARRRARSQARREDRGGDAGGPPRAPPLGGPLAGAALGAGGLPPPLAAARARPARRGRGASCGCRPSSWPGPAGRRREPGKSDPIDALAVARAALREPDLPVARLDGPERELRLLVDHREDLVAERTRAQNRLRWHLHELMPGEEPPPRALDRRHVLDGARGAPREPARARSPASPATSSAASAS